MNVSLNKLKNNDVMGGAKCTARTARSSTRTLYTTLVEKVVERVVYNKFYPFVENRIYYLQHGFMKGRSTVTQLLAIVHQLSKSIDERGQTDIAYLDFTKAFDSDNFIIDKLYSIGIRGPLLKWFRSYLHGNNG